jgi:hypothetical protein
MDPEVVKAIIYAGPPTVVALGGFIQALRNGAKQDLASEKQDIVLKEVTTNSGSSMKDAADKSVLQNVQIIAKIDSLGAKVETLDKKLGEHHAYLMWFRWRTAKEVVHIGLGDLAASESFKYERAYLEGLTPEQRAEYLKYDEKEFIAKRTPGQPYPPPIETR